MDNWVNVTVIGDDYDVELNVRTNRYRHRPFRCSVIEDWRAGRPPKGFHAKSEDVNTRKPK